MSKEQIDKEMAAIGRFMDLLEESKKHNLTGEVLRSSLMFLFQCNKGHFADTLDIATDCAWSEWDL